MIRAFILRVVFLLPISLLLADCSDAAIDCGSICSRYQDCFDADYDVESCADRCEDAADNDRDYRDKADACHDCIEDRSCGGSAFSCAAECIGVVP